MLQFFRNFFKSKVGAVFTLVFLGLIAFAFASSDIASTGTFGGVSGGDQVAVVGDRKIGAADLATNLNSALEQARQQDPRLTMAAFIDNGGLETVLDQTLERAALAEYGKMHGLRAGDRLVDSEILQISAFRGADGKFDQTAFQSVLQRQGLTEAAVREDLAMGLFARQLLTPATVAPQVPQSFALRYASLLGERRRGNIAGLPSAAYAPQGAPSAEQLQSFYNTTRRNYTRPERRVIRFASFGEAALGNLRAPSDAEIAARYRRDAALYAASERRTLTQLVAPTQAAAQQIATEVRGGTSLDASARAKGLATTTVGPVTQRELAASTSAQAAQAAFAAAEGTIAAPARGALGWFVLRVDDAERTPARALAQVRGEIAAALTEEQRRSALADLTARIEEEFEEGRSLSEVARELGATLSRTPSVTADGRVYGSPDQRVPQTLAPALEAAFEMEEGEPQLAEIEAGKTFLVFDVAEIVPSATAPLAEIRNDVIQLWRLRQGAIAARQGADRVMQRLRSGQTLAAAVQAEKRSLPQPQSVNLTRADISQQGQVPPVLALLFSMAEGTVKRLEMPSNTGTFVVHLGDIEPGKVAAGDPLVGATMQQLAPVVGQEYLRQFLAAVQREVPSERNKAAVDAVAAQLTGRNN